MKSLLQLLFSLLFVSSLPGQENASYPLLPKHNTQAREARDPWSNIKDPARQNRFDRERHINSARSEMQRSSQYPTPMHTISGSGVDIDWVRHYGSGLIPSADAAVVVVVDAIGNGYVTGSSNGDYVTIKYTSAGDTAWVRRYNGPGKSDDGAIALAVDASGNVYVTGSSDGDYATIKYTSTGDTAWVRRYGGGGANALAVDASGNVYVTGWCEIGYATIKYTSAGDTAWVRRYIGPGNGRDYATALAVDASGNVYVTGKSDASGGNADYATIKYSSAGDTSWVRRYNGPENSHDAATAIAVDASGNVYVTGQSDGSGGNADYATIKYTSAGDTEWVRRYNGPGNSGDYATALAVDASGNVYVTGWSGNFDAGYFDYATIKYTSAGDTAWVRLYGGGVAHAIAVDASRNVYVTGSSTGSNSNTDYVTIKYTSPGDTAWVRRYNGPGNTDGSDAAAALAVDASGNVYVTGHSDGSGTYGDYATIKYTSAGDTAWVRRYNGPGNGYDGAIALAVDANGNVYVMGNSDAADLGMEAYTDYATVKYTSNGDTAWVRRYNGPGNSWDYAAALAVDASGNVYVTGSSGGSGTSYDYATIKYTSAGDTAWVRRYGGGGATALAVDASGNVYVTGRSYGSGTDNDYATIKYTSAGDTAWFRRYNGPGNYYDEATAIAVDASGNVYVTGSSAGQIATIKYDAAGNQVWLAQYSYPGGTSTSVGLKLDTQNNVYVAGTSSVNDQCYYTIIKYAQTPNAVRRNDGSVPTTFALSQNFPNPFNPLTTIRYSLPLSANVKLAVYDLLGREITTLVNEEQSAGWKEVEWNAKNISSGIYFYKLTTGIFVDIKKMIVVK